MPSATAREIQRAATVTGLHETAPGVTVPLHGGREIGPPLFFKILRQMGVSLEEFDRLR